MSLKAHSGTKWQLASTHFRGFYWKNSFIFVAIKARNRQKNINQIYRE